MNNGVSLNDKRAAALLTILCLPADDWEPHHWDAHEAARETLMPLREVIQKRIKAADERRTQNGKAPVKRQTRSKGLRPVSAKRAAEKPERDTVREHVLERDRRCIPADRGMPGACQVYGGRDPLEVHEIAARGTHPGSHLDPDLCVAACPRHHDDITNATGDLLEMARELDLRRKPTT